MIRWIPDITPWLGLQGDTMPSDRPLPALRDARHVDGLGPERHTVAVAKQFGDWYATCSCQAMSLPCWNQAAAERWVCPRLESEAEVLRAQLRYDVRVTDAGNWGRS